MTSFLHRRLLPLFLVLFVAGSVHPAPAAEGHVRPYEASRMPISTPPDRPFAATSAASGTVINPASRRLYQWMHLFGGGLTPSTWLAAFDLDSMKQLASVQLPYQAVFGGPETVDSENGRIFMAVRDESRMKGLAVIDDKNFAVDPIASVKLVETPQHPAYNSAIGVLTPGRPGPVAGIRYEPSSRKVLLALSPQREVDSVALNGPRGRQVYATFIAQWNAAPDQAMSQGWVHPVRECNSGPIGTEVEATDAPFLSKDGKAVQFLCGSGETGWQFVSLPLDADGNAGPSASSKVTPAPSNIQRIVVDPAAQRTHVFAESSYGATYDWANQRLIGTFAVSHRVHAGSLFPGIDPASGRLYVMVPPVPGDASARPELGGLLMIDGRRSVLPQALVFREFVEPAAVNYIQVDPAFDGRIRRAFVRSGPPGGVGHPYINVLADPVPISVDPLAADLDRTADTEESARTERSFAGEASGYGSRALVVGGLYRGQLQQFTGACGQSSRELRVGSVPRSGLASVGALARADAADADLGTRGDVEDLSRCWPQYDRLNVPGWPAPPAQMKENSTGWASKPAECSGDTEKSAEDAMNSAGSSAVTCAFSKELVDAQGTYSGVQTGPVSVGRSHSETHLRRVDGKGIVSTAESVAESVTIDGVGSIGLVRSFGESYAKGRTPKKGDPPRTVWEVQLCGVRTADYTQEGCNDPKQAVGALNEAGRGRILFSRPAADRDLMAGTPRGYLAALQRDRGEASIALVENGDESLIIPGLEIQVRNTATTTETHRYVLQLAGVRTASVYGISVMPPEIPEMNVPLEPLEIPSDAPSILETDIGGGDFTATPPPPTKPKSPLRRIIEEGGELVQAGFRWFRRTAPQTLLMVGVWATFGVPGYLAIRRRRLMEAA